MSGGQRVRSGRVARVIQQRRELDVPVAQDVRVGRDARLVVPDHLAETPTEAGDGRPEGWRGEGCGDGGKDGGMEERTVARENRRQGPWGRRRLSKAVTT